MYIYIHICIHSIALLDPEDTGVIAVVDFYGVFQKRQKKPRRRARTKNSEQCKSFPRGLVRPGVCIKKKKNSEQRKSFPRGLVRPGVYMFICIYMYMHGCMDASVCACVY